MDGQHVRRTYAAAALACAGITAAVVFYAVVVELLRWRGYAAPVAPPAAYALKLALYVLGASAMMALKFTAPVLERRKEDAARDLQWLAGGAIIRAALCEMPALAGLVLFLLTGYRADFYMLTVFALALEVYHFPRLSAWEERLRGAGAR